MDDNRGKEPSKLHYQNSLSDDYELDEDDADRNSNDEQNSKTQEWSEIPLNTTMSHSNSMNSCESQNLGNNDTAERQCEPKREEKSLSSGLSDWISKSSFRRQSLEDVFTQSTLFGKFGRERRNSETSVETCSSSTPSSNKRDFFLFGRQEDLTDSQIDNFFLSPDNL